MFYSMFLFISVIHVLELKGIIFSFSYEANICVDSSALHLHLIFYVFMPPLFSLMTCYIWRRYEINNLSRGRPAVVASRAKSANYRRVVFVANAIAHVVVEDG